MTHLLICLAPVERKGFEPLTAGLQDQCSTKLSYNPLVSPPLRRAGTLHHPLMMRRDGVN